MDGFLKANRKLHETPFYKSFMETCKKKSKDISDEDEAREAAWDCRRAQLKQFIIENGDEIMEKIHERKEEDEEEEDEIDGDKVDE